MKRKILAVIFAAAMIFTFTATACGGGEGGHMENKITFTIGETELSATLAENTATEELIKRLKTAPLTIEMRDYGGWEKVGSLGFDLPASDEEITAQPCEFVLYQGNQLVIFYGSNSWSYTRLGKFENVTQAELKQILGSGNVTITLSL